MKQSAAVSKQLPFWLLMYDTHLSSQLQKINGEHPRWYEQHHGKYQDEATEMVEQWQRF